MDVVKKEVRLLVQNDALWYHKDISELPVL